jgi:hypothetical protein
MPTINYARAHYVELDKRNVALHKRNVVLPVERC